MTFQERSLVITSRLSPNLMKYQESNASTASSVVPALDGIAFESQVCF